MIKKPQTRDDQLAALTKFMKTNPDIERIEAIFPTINGINRGKWVPASDIRKLVDQRMRLPISTYALDSWGYDVEDAGLGIVNGDPDGIGVPITDSISRMPWSSEPAAQILMSMVMRDEEATPCPFDPRQQLIRQVEKMQALGLNPVVAMELEFYLIKPMGANDSRPQPFLVEPSGNLNNLDHMLEFEGILSAIRKACKVQNVDADVVLAEAGMCQFEINFNHVDDALRAADQATLFKRIVKGCAKIRDMEATFMAKPFGDDIGSGLHIHVSLLDESGKNIFDSDAFGAGPSSNLKHATGGLVASMAELQAIFAPNRNSYRRFRPGSFAPNEASWGIDHRAAAVRLPEITGPASRLEHRICGADANPYLALSAVLGGIIHGLEHKIDPGPSIDTQKPQNIDPLHHDWRMAINAFDQSQIARQIFGENFHHVYTILRRHENAKLASLISDVELNLYLHSA